MYTNIIPADLSLQTHHSVLAVTAMAEENQNWKKKLQLAVTEVYLGCILYLFIGMPNIFGMISGMGFKSVWCTIVVFGMYQRVYIKAGQHADDLLWCQILKT